MLNQTHIPFLTPNLGSGLKITSHSDPGLVFRQIIRVEPAILSVSIIASPQDLLEVCHAFPAKLV